MSAEENKEEGPERGPAAPEYVNPSHPNAAGYGVSPHHSAAYYYPEEEYEEGGYPHPYTPSRPLHPHYHQTPAGRSPYEYDDPYSRPYEMDAHQSPEEAAAAAAAIHRGEGRWHPAEAPAPKRRGRPKGEPKPKPEPKKRGRPKKVAQVVPQEAVPQEAVPPAPQAERLSHQDFMRYVAMQAHFSKQLQRDHWRSLVRFKVYYK